jgi:hypothetical protein
MMIEDNINHNNKIITKEEMTMAHKIIIMIMTDLKKTIILITNNHNKEVRIMIIMIILIMETISINKENSNQFKIRLMI